MKLSGKERRMTRKGSIFLPSTSVLDSDKWRPPFSELSNRASPPLLSLSLRLFRSLSYVASDVVPLINEELELSLFERGEAISQGKVVFGGRKSRISSDSELSVRRTAATDGILLVAR